MQFVAAAGDEDFPFSLQPIPHTKYDGGDFCRQLKYANPVLPLFQCFQVNQFVVSVQQPSGGIIARTLPGYRNTSIGLFEALHIERSASRPSELTHFDVTLTQMPEGESDGQTISPCSLNLVCWRCYSQEGCKQRRCLDSSMQTFVPKLVVQMLLEGLVSVGEVE